jgi:hypothetical protein
MRFVRGDVTDHIVLRNNDHGPSCKEFSPQRSVHSDAIIEMKASSIMKAP